MAKKKSEPTALIPVERIEQKIFLIRGLKVMLDTDLAAIYDVQTFRLNEAVKRNRRRFPDDFMLQISSEEARSLTSQFAISKAGRGGRRTLPYAFTEHGVAMLSSVLNSERAVEMNILIIRASIKLREILATHKDLAARMEKLEAEQKKHTSVIRLLAEEIDHLRQPEPIPQKRRIGFAPPEKPEREEE